jgi:uroporphyrinogen decarboxylase
MNSASLTGQERVMMALNFQEPDHVPRHEHFWDEFVDAWRLEKGLAAEVDPVDHYGIDMVIAEADETTWPTRAGLVEQRGNESIERSGWGSLQRVVEGSKFFDELEPALPERVDPDTLEFDDPLLDFRYEEAGETADRYRGRCAVFCKTGGPYLRAAWMRGTTNFLFDIAEDPEWVKTFVDRVTDNMLQVGVEQIRRYGLQSTGIGIFDDIATNRGLIMGLKSYEKIFYPSLCKMVRAYKEAGAAKVFHHCDGYVEDVLDLWVAAGIDAVHPLEARTGMDVVEIREKYDGRLAIIGGLDNCAILPRGDREQVREHVLHALRAGRGGGLVLAAHSIGPDVSVQTYDYVAQLCREHGSYPLGCPMSPAHPEPNL